MKQICVLVIALSIGCMAPAETLFESLGIEEKPQQPAPQTPPLPKKLGPLDRWRYEACLKDASKAPTELGVRSGMRLCRDKFEQ
jgi:hypothetical protein